MQNDQLLSTLSMFLDSLKVVESRNILDRLTGDVVTKLKKNV